MSIITFTSDFGLKDHYVASVKANILSGFPQTQIIDITHLINSCNIVQAAYTINSVYKEFPKNTIHIIAVNTTHAQNGNHLLIQMQEQYFIVPDNGMFSLLDTQNEKKVYLLDINERYQPTFPAKFYAFVAVQLLKGGNASVLGNLSESILQKISRKLQVQPNKIKGNIIHIDHYGNLVTNISLSVFNEVRNDRKFSIKFAHENFSHLDKNYHSQDYGDCVVLFNSNELLEISIHQGNANQLLGMKYDDEVTVQFFPDV